MEIGDNLAHMRYYQFKKIIILNFTSQIKYLSDVFIKISLLILVGVEA